MVVRAMGQMVAQMASPMMMHGRSFLPIHRVAATPKAGRQNRADC